MSKEFDKAITFEVSGIEIASVIDNYPYDVLKIDFTDWITKLFIKDNPKVNEKGHTIKAEASKKLSVDGKIIISQYISYEKNMK